MILLDRIVRIIVDRRNLLFLIYGLLIVFCLFSFRWVKVENDIIYYLDEDSKTRQSISVLNEEFTTFGTANIMISNISYTHAKEIAVKIENIKGVSTLMFENTDDYYKNTSALFVATFTARDSDQITLDAMAQIRELVAPYDSSINSTVGFDQAKQLTKDMTIVGVLAAIVVFMVLLFTSKSYAEIPILLMTFGAAALLNIGSNFLLGKISFISHSVAVVLQLALAIDYAIIFCHRFTEEFEKLPAREAAITALRKAIPEISSSSLTTIAGLGAMAFMKFGIGKDLAAVMIKAIFLSMLSVFTLMPGLLVAFSDHIKKTQHRSFIPSVSSIGRFSIKTRFVMPPVFLVVLLASFILSMKCPFVFSMNEIRPHRVTETLEARDRIRENFGTSNMVALMVPSGNYTAERKLIASLEKFDEIDMVVGISNTEAMGGYMLTDYLTPRQFSELLDLDYEMAQLLYSLYALNDEDYAKIISGVNQYGIPLIDMFQFMIEQVKAGYVTLEDDLMNNLKEYEVLLANARSQLESPNYSRIVLMLKLPEEGEETFDFLSEIYDTAYKYYDETVYMVGQSTNAWDLSLSFESDNLIISILSVLFVVIILTFTFQSAGLPFLLISVIQASIWINFSFPYLRGQGIYFLGYLIVSAIQMGANIDYAIVMTSRYLALKKEIPPREAVIEALNQGFPTVVTSGTILATAGILIGYISTDGATAVLGSYLGYGTIISMILVIFVLPQILYLGDIIIERTSFRIKTHAPIYEAKGKVHISGKLQGYVEGEIDAHVEGSIKGKIHAMLDTRDTARQEEENEEALYEKD